MKYDFIINKTLKKLTLFLATVLIFSLSATMAQEAIVLNKRCLVNNDKVPKQEIDRITMLVREKVVAYAKCINSFGISFKINQKEDFEKLFYPTPNTLIYLDYRSDVENLQYKKIYYKDFIPELSKITPNGIIMQTNIAKNKTFIVSIQKINEGYDCKVYVENIFQEMISKERQGSKYVLVKNPLSTKTPIGIVLSFKIVGESALIYDIDKSSGLMDCPTGELKWFMGFNALVEPTILKNEKIFPEMKVSPNLAFGGELNVGFTVKKLTCTLGAGLLSNKYNIDQTNEIKDTVDAKDKQDTTKYKRFMKLSNLSSTVIVNNLQIPIAFSYRLYRSKDEKFSLNVKGVFIPTLVLKATEKNIVGKVYYNGSGYGYKDPETGAPIGLEIDSLKNEFYHFGDFNIKKDEVTLEKSFYFRAGAGIEANYRMSEKMSFSMSATYTMSIIPQFKSEREKHIFPETEEVSDKGLFQQISTKTSNSGISLRVGIQYHF
jgi:hypothetical protein